MKQGIKKHFKKTIYFASVSIIGTVLGLTLQFTSAAWINPPASPPNSNVGAPINTGSVYQAKSGGLGTSYSEITTVDEPTLYLHRPGLYATGMKLKSDNRLWFGGWSAPEGGAVLVAGDIYAGAGTPLAMKIKIGRGAGNVSSNTAIGLNALNVNTSGYYNTATGYLALSANKAGALNTATGYNALQNSVDVHYNTATGAESLRLNQGHFNTATGTYSLFSNQGSYNTAMGAFAFSNENLGTNTGEGNTATGAYSLANNNSGHHNTASGFLAMRYNSSGFDNTAQGVNALNLNTSGNGNTAIGRDALISNDSGTYNTAVGINVLLRNISGGSNTAIGSSSLTNNTTGNLNIAIGNATLNGNVTGSNNIAIGYSAGVAFSTPNLSNTVVLGNMIAVSTSNTVRLGNAAVQIIEGAVPFSPASDRRLKENIQETDLGLDFILKLKPVSYKYKNGSGTDYGFIAQDVEEAIGKKTNIILTDNTPEGMKSMRYDDLISPMVKAMQEQQQQIEDLKAQIETLKNK